jgi:hypothetical protein
LPAGFAEAMDSVESFVGFTGVACDDQNLWHDS